MKTSLALLALFGAMPALVADWLSFRGPDAIGSSPVSEALAIVDQSSIQWTVDLPGEGVGTPLVVGERLFLTCSSGPHQEELHVRCHATGDGALLWERRFWATGRVMHHEKTAVAAPTPASDGKRIFALYSSNDLLCLDLDGNLQWIRGLTVDYPNASNSLGLASSPVVAGETVVVHVENDSESFAAGLDVESGRNRWKIDRTKKANWCSPVTYPGSDGNPILVLQGSAGLDGIDPLTGKRIWSYGDGASTTTSTAVAPDGRLFVPSHGLTALQPSDASEPTQLWRSEQQSPGTGSPNVLGNRVFTINRSGVLTAARVEDGERLWRLRLEGPFSSSSVIAGRQLYAISEKGLLQVVDLDTPEGEVVASVNLGETILASPAVSGGALYVRSNGKLWKLGGAQN